MARSQVEEEELRRREHQARLRHARQLADAWEDAWMFDTVFDEWRLKRKDGGNPLGLHTLVAHRLIRLAQMIWERGQAEAYFNADFPTDFSQFPRDMRAVHAAHRLLAETLQATSPFVASSPNVPRVVEAVRKVSEVRDLLSDVLGPPFGMEKLRSFVEYKTTEAKPAEGADKRVNLDTGHVLPEKESVAEESEDADELNPRERELLQAYNALNATTKRTRVSRTRAARKAEPGSPPSTYNRANAKLVKKGYLRVGTKAEKGGCWLTTKGIEAVARLSKAKPE